MNNQDMMLKKNKIKYLIIYGALFLLSIKAYSADAPCTADSVPACYTPLVPDAFPGVTLSGNFGDLLVSIFKYGIAACVALSAIMIIWGGIELMTTDSWTGKLDGKTKITNALIGLGIALLSWLLLYTINPRLVDFTGNTLLAPPPTVVGTNTQLAVPGAGTTPATSAVVPCPTCVVNNMTALGIPCKAGINCSTNGVLARKLQQVNLTSFNAYITEGYPPQSAAHTAGTCHNSGSCVDLNFTPSADKSVAKAKLLWDKMVSVGIGGNFESATEATCLTYRTAGVTCHVFNGTGDHFHVY